MPRFGRVCGVCGATPVCSVCADDGSLAECSVPFRDGGVTVDNVGRAVSGILAYAMLESASFILLVAITRRHCGIRALYQLAFVLETQWSLVLSKIVLWMLFTLAFRIVHFGKFVPRRRSWFWLNRF